MIKKLIFATTALFFFTTPSFADVDGDNIALAQVFLDILDTGNADDLDPLVGEGMVFEDITWGAKVEGRDKVLKAYHNYRGGVQKLEKVLLNVFATNGTVVLTYVMHAEIGLQPGKPESGTFGAMGPVIRVVGIKDGKVVRHIDLADYGRIAGQRAAALAKSQKTD